MRASVFIFENECPVSNQGKETGLKKTFLYHIKRYIIVKQIYIVELHAYSLQLSFFKRNL